MPLMVGVYAQAAAHQKWATAPLEIGRLVRCRRQAATVIFHAAALTTRQPATHLRIPPFTGLLKEAVLPRSRKRDAQDTDARQRAPDKAPVSERAKLYPRFIPSG